MGLEGQALGGVVADHLGEGGDGGQGLGAGAAVGVHVGEEAGSERSSSRRARTAQRAALRSSSREPKASAEARGRRREARRPERRWSSSTERKGRPRRSRAVRWRRRRAGAGPSRGACPGAGPRPPWSSPTGCGSRRPAHLDPVALGVLDELGGGVEAHGLAVEQRRRRRRRDGELEPGETVDQQREAGGVGSPESRSSPKPSIWRKQRGRSPRRSRAPACPRQLAREVAASVLLRSTRAMARRSLSASPGVKPAATMASFIACSWNSGTPRVFQHPAELRSG